MDDQIFLDIETIPCQDEASKAKLLADAKPPANYKSPEAIAKWRGEKSADLVAKTSFDGGRGHVCCIGWALGDEPPFSLSAKSVRAESGIIAAFFASLGRYHSKTLVGHYIHGFDIRFMTQRAIVLGVKLPPSNIWPRDPKPWDTGLADTMAIWAGAKGTIGLDALCDILGIPGKGDFTGAMVADAWANGYHEKIAEYCRADVERTRSVYRKFQNVGW
ncbi:MAG: hypothetical protein GY767_17820 [Shimia sp.]|nr:hypothetical protein [Shimia sp.]